MMNEKQIGKNIRTLREEKQLSQEEFADRLGVTRKAVSAWEVGRSFPKMMYVNKMCDIFGCKISDITEDKWADTPISEEFKFVPNFYRAGEQPDPAIREAVLQRRKMVMNQEYTEEEREIIQLYRTLSPDHQDDIYKRIMQLKIEERSERRGNKV